MIARSDRIVAVAASVAFVRGRDQIEWLLSSGASVNFGSIFRVGQLTRVGQKRVLAAKRCTSTSGSKRTSLAEQYPCRAASFEPLKGAGDRLSRGRFEERRSKKKARTPKSGARLSRRPRERGLT